MRVGIPRETTQGERRVALVPETVGKLAAVGFELVVEQGAGTSASFPDDAYTDAGAVSGDPWDADGVVKVRKPSPDERERLRSGQLLIAFLEPLSDPTGVEALEARGITAFAMESIPRITRAQPMDALSSQATVGGYKGALLAAEQLPRFFPMLMTAAGTVPPAKVLVIGAGVAGLQAIATPGRAASTLLPDADDGCGHRAARESARDRRGRRGIAGDRDGAPARRRRHGLRRPPRRPRADPVARRELARSRRRRRGSRGGLRARADAGRDAGTAARARGADRRVRRRDHDRGRSGPRGAEDHPGVRRGGDAAWFRHRRPRRRHRRQLRADAARRDRRARGRDARGPHEPAEHDAVPRLDAVFAQRQRALAASRARRRAQPGLERRDHRRGLRGRQEGGSDRVSHNTLLVFEVTILVLAIFLGIEVISKVPTLLHTPLMSGTNAIHGVVIVGAMIVLGLPHKSAFTWIVGFAAVVLAAANVVGGFVVTDRMLEMFKSRQRPKPTDDA